MACESTGPSDAELASRCLFEAWQTGNRDAALEVAWPQVVEELFAITPGGDGEFVACEGFTCRFVDPAADGVHGREIVFGAAPDADPDSGDGQWYVGRMETFEY